MGCNWQGCLSLLELISDLSAAQRATEFNAYSTDSAALFLSDVFLFSYSLPFGVKIFTLCHCIIKICNFLFDFYGLTAASLP